MTKRAKAAIEATSELVTQLHQPYNQNLPDKINQLAHVNVRVFNVKPDQVSLGIFVDQSDILDYKNGDRTLANNAVGPERQMYLLARWIDAAPEINKLSIDQYRCLIARIRLVYNDDSLQRISKITIRNHGFDSSQETEVGLDICFAISMLKQGRVWASFPTLDPANDYAVAKAPAWPSRAWS